MKRALLSLGLLLATLPAAATVKNCDELKDEIDGKLKAKGVSGYELTIVAADAEAAATAVEVGSCDGGNKKILYKRG